MFKAFFSVVLIQNKTNHGKDKKADGPSGQYIRSEFSPHHPATPVHDVVASASCSQGAYLRAVDTTPVNT